MRGRLGKIMADFQNEVVRICQSMLFQYSANQDTFIDFVSLQRMLIDAAPIARTLEEITFFRKFTYALTYRSEARAIELVTGNKEKTEITDEMLHQIAHSEIFDAASMKDTIRYNYDRLTRKIVDAFQSGVMMRLTPQEIIDRVKGSLPRPTFRTKLKRLKKHVREAKTKTPEIDSTFVDENTWSSLIDQYLTDLPDRSAAAKLSDPLTTAQGEVLFYDWELEKTLTEDFVEKVRQGQIDAAKKKGITDFLWVAVIDDKTDECCKKRDGLLVSEIARKLKSSWKGDDCQAKTPPAHFNCRCDISPVDENLPESPPDGAEGFEDWLNET